MNWNTGLKYTDKQGDNDNTVEHNDEIKSVNMTTNRQTGMEIVQTENKLADLLLI